MRTTTRRHGNVLAYDHEARPSTTDHSQPPLCGGCAERLVFDTFAGRWTHDDGRP